MYHPQVEVCTPHQHQHPGHDSHLWQDSKCYRKDTPETCKGVLRSREVPLRLGGEPREEHGPVGEDWGHNGVKMKFGRSSQEGGEQR